MRRHQLVLSLRVRNVVNVPVRVDGLDIVVSLQVPEFEAFIVADTGRA